jgi:hypothetical protein
VLAQIRVRNLMELNPLEAVMKKAWGVAKVPLAHSEVRGGRSVVIGTRGYVSHSPGFDKNKWPKVVTFLLDGGEIQFDWCCEKGEFEFDPY